MSYIIMEECKLVVKDNFYITKRLTFSYPFLEYASSYILYYAEKAQEGCITQQALVQQLQQLHRGFEQLRSFYDVF